MALNIVLLVLGVLFIAAVIIALVRPHQKVKTKVKVLGAEFDLQAEGGEPAAAPRPPRPPPRRASPPRAFTAAAPWACATAPAAASRPATWRRPAT